MTRTARLVPVLAASLLLLGACGGTGGSGGDGGSDGSQGGDASSAVPAGMVEVSTDVGTVARPEEWQPLDGAQTKDRTAGFVIEDDSGEVVGQMDVFVNQTAPATDADTLAGAIQGARMPSFPNLRHVRREFADVPGAESAFLTESTYTTADTGQPARSLDLVAIGKDGKYLLVRISSAQSAYDAALFQKVVDTMRLDRGASS